MRIAGVMLKIHELIVSTGLQIKADPGIPFVYTGFGLLMLDVMVSYVSHSQIWTLQEDSKNNHETQANSLYFRCKNNRAQVAFERELVSIVEELKTKSTLNQ